MLGATTEGCQSALDQRPESSRQATVTVTAAQATVTAVGGLSAGGRLTETTGIADANILKPLRRRA